jgi:putative acetyltransferase
MNVQILDVDPQAEEALALLREAAIDVWPLYGERDPADAPSPGNDPLPDRGVYVIAYVERVPAACGALQPLDEQTAEARRMYVHRDYRRRGIAGAVLKHLIGEARRLGFTTIVLETGNKQTPAMALYAAFGFTPIPPFAEHVGDPTSVCYELSLSSRRVI